MSSVPRLRDRMDTAKSGARSDQMQAKDIEHPADEQGSIWPRTSAGMRSEAVQQALLKQGRQRSSSGMSSQARIPILT